MHELDFNFLESTNEEPVLKQVKKFCTEGKKRKLQRRVKNLENEKVQNSVKDEISNCESEKVEVSEKLSVKDEISEKPTGSVLQKFIFQKYFILIMKCKSICFTNFLEK